MNTRDPFSLRRPSPTSPFASIQYSFAKAGPQSSDNTTLQPSDKETAVTGSDMSQAVPRHAHSSSNDQQYESSTWQPRRPQHETHLGAFEEKFNDLFGSKDGLPMYKDKPYNYSASRRRQPFWRRRRLLVPVVVVLTMLLYWSGLFSRSSGEETRRTPKMKLGRTDWDARREKVRDAFQRSWKAYEIHAMGYDEFHPVSKTGKYMVPGGMGWIIVDALDTMMIMNLTTELTHAREWVYKSLSYDKDHDVNTFETTIRMLGGLLSAHYLSDGFPDMAPVENKETTGGEDLYLEKATGLAERLLGAYDSKSGIPYASIKLHTGEGIPSHDVSGASSTAEAGTLQLEMKYLSNLTGEQSFWTTAEKVIKVIDDNGVHDGLVPIYISPDSGQFQGENIRLGSRGDSYYEYLIKQYLQTSKEEPIYLELWEQALLGVQKHLITYTQHANLTVLAERPQGLSGPLFPKMDHLVCFMPGTVALAATGGATLADARKSASWGAKQEAEIELAKQLMKTCWGMYAVTVTGLSPEIAHFHLENPAPLMKDGVRTSPETLSDDPKSEWRKDFDIHSGDLHNLQRPETVESLFYMWRITRDERYREQGWTMFQAFMAHTGVGDDAAQGYTSIGNVNTLPAPPRDNMESFWLAETLKYFYLLFGPDDVLPLDKVVFNTEAHPFPRFSMGKGFKTGWTRKPRDKDGNVIGGAPSPLKQENVMPPVVPADGTLDKAGTMEEKPKPKDGHDVPEQARVVNVAKAPIAADSPPQKIPPTT